MTPTVSLLLGTALLAAWLVLTFVVPTGTGLVHALLAAGVLLLVRWIALRDGAPAR
ncbi:MAG TPA: hypothetical protein VFX50_06945 [Gemmatimonadales bacterium]|nr:hypothetical protein [Gemmatimonadales bacterium]